MYQLKTPKKHLKTSAMALSVLLALSACSSSDDDADDNSVTVEQPDADTGQTVSVQLDSAQEIPAPQRSTCRRQWIS